MWKCPYCNFENVYDYCGKCGAKKPDEAIESEYIQGEYYQTKNDSHANYSQGNQANYQSSNKGNEQISKQNAHSFESNNQNKKSQNNKIQMIIIYVLIALIICAFGVIAVKKFTKKNDVPVQSGQKSNQKVKLLWRLTPPFFFLKKAYFLSKTKILTV